MRIIEVGPRDGLQNESSPIPTAVKAEFIAALAQAGLKEIEATSFVSPKWVPQLADAAELWPILPAGPLYSALAPNERGLLRALEVGVDRIAFFTAASEDFTQRNINMTIAESLDGFRGMAAEFRRQRPNGWIRGYVSTAFECPFAGRISPEQVVPVVEELLAIGCDEISLGDTVGAAAPVEVRALNALVSQIARPGQLAWHFHDTRGTAVANVAAALDFGATAFDSSAGGLGGCPYAPGAGGNLATEDLVYFLERSGVPTGIDREGLARATQPILSLLGRAPSSKAQLAVLARSTGS